MPLSAPAQMLLVKRRAAADAELQDIKRKIAKADPERRQLEERRRRVELYVFPARDGRTGHLSELKKAWVSLCRAAGIVELREVTDKQTGRTKTIVRHAARIHDLRHTAASVLASGGASLPLIGQLLWPTHRPQRPRDTRTYSTMRNVQPWNAWVRLSREVLLPKSLTSKSRGRGGDRQTCARVIEGG